METTITKTKSAELSAFGGKDYISPAQYVLTEGKYEFVWNVPFSAQEEEENGLIVKYDGDLVGLWRWQGQDDNCPSLEEAEIIAREIVEKDLRP